MAEGLEYSGLAHWGCRVAELEDWEWEMLAVLAIELSLGFLSGFPHIAHLIYNL